MKILDIEKDSPAEALGLEPGDELIEINGHPIRDEIDFQFYSADEPLRLLVKRGEDLRTFAQRQTWLGNFGAHFLSLKYRCCGNRCVFCFIDQNPPGLRPALYFKDEDFRLSFLYGNYVTLTNTSRRDLERMVEQRLSPLYISIHAVDPLVRQRMLGLRRHDHLLEKIDFLAGQGIVLHAQIVLCPGLNDGAVLQDSLQRLETFYPALQTVAVVPVGLTRFRQDLLSLRPVNKSAAAAAVAEVERRSQACWQKWQTHWIYAADELYLTAGLDLPASQRYDEFSQIENGVGLCRAVITKIHRQKRYFLKQVGRKKITLVTGRSAGPVLTQHLLPALQATRRLTIQLAVIDNNFFGKSVTVSGLLTGRDIARQLKKKHLGDLVVLPPNCLNHDGLFLDEWTPRHLEQSLGVSVRQAFTPLDIYKLV
jgi:putative radical SAM enzyme (TIGR03279 family)